MLRGRIVLVSFPFDDMSSEKVRPAVCLTDALGRHRHVIVAFVSSRTPVDPQPSDLTVDAMHPAFASTGLRVTSTVRLHRLMTLAIPLLRRELGILPPDLLDAASSKLKVLFTLT